MTHRYPIPNPIDQPRNDPRSHLIRNPSVPSPIFAGWGPRIRL